MDAGTGARGGPLRRWRWTPQRRQAVWGVLFALPAAVFFVGLFAYPLVYTVFLSLHQWDLLSPPTWVGLRNYSSILQDSEFQNSLLVTLYYVAGTCVPIWILSVLLAAFFNQTFWLRQVSLTLFYLPVAVSLTVWTIMWKLVLNPSYGLLTLLTDHIGFHYIPWLSDSRLAMPAIILLSIWKGVPYYTVIVLAGMRALPRDYYDAARVDGAMELPRLSGERSARRCRKASSSVYLLSRCEARTTAWKEERPRRA